MSIMSKREYATSVLRKITSLSMQFASIFMMPRTAIVKNMAYLLLAYVTYSKTLTSAWRGAPSVAEDLREDNERISPKKYTRGV